jgi:hypothetical protein
MAGTPGFEPRTLLLERRSLPLAYVPNFYFLASLWTVYFLHHLQNFFNANFRSPLFCLDLRV